MSSRLLGAVKPFSVGPFARAPYSSIRMSSSSAYKVATSGKPFTSGYRVHIRTISTHFFDFALFIYFYLLLFLPFPTFQNTYNNYARGDCKFNVYLYF